MQLGLFDLACQVQVVSAAFAHRHAHTWAIHFFIALQRRVLADQIAALDQDIRRGKSNALSTHRIDCKKPDVSQTVGHSIHGLARGIEHHQGQTDTQSTRQLGGQVNGNAHRLTGCRILLGEDGIAQIDRGTQRAGWGKLLSDGGHGLGQR